MQEQEKWKHLMFRPGQTRSLNSNFPTFEDLSKTKWHKTTRGDKIAPLGAQMKGIKNHTAASLDTVRLQ